MTANPPFRTIQLQRDTAANWTSANTLLAEGELGLEMDTRKAKIGDGVTQWNSLSYAFSSVLGMEKFTYDPANINEQVVGLTATQTFSTGIKTFLDGILGLRNVANTFTSFFTNTATAARTWTLPDSNTIIPIISQILTFSGPTAARTITLPDASFTVARTDAANTFTGTQTITQIDLGNADTSISRESAGQISVKGVRARLKNPLVVSDTSYTTNTGTSLNMDNLDMFIVTAQAGALLFNAPGGTLVQGRQLIIRIKDNGTARALTWNAVFRAMGTALPSTTVLSKTLYLGFIYNSTDTKWDLVASAQEA